MTTTTIAPADVFRRVAEVTAELPVPDGGALHVRYSTHVHEFGPVARNAEVGIHDVTDEVWLGHFLHQIGADEAAEDTRQEGTGYVVRRRRFNGPIPVVVYSPLPTDDGETDCPCGHVADLHSASWGCLGTINEDDECECTKLRAQVIARVTR